MGNGAVTICQICYRTDAFGPIRHDIKWHLAARAYEKKKRNSELRGRRIALALIKRHGK